MTAIGALQNYKHGRKNQWRNWVWREIARRVDDVGSAKVLYMPCVEDFDRAVAVRNGFSPNNLYAVDKDKSIVAQLRKNNVLAIHGDFFDVAMADADFFDVHCADLCEGVTRKVVCYVINLVAAGTRDKAVLLNMTRAHDRMGAMLSEAVDRKTKDRARLLMNFYAKFLHKNWFPSLDHELHQCTFIPFFEQMFLPVFRSYKGCGVVMDSVVFRMPKGTWQALHQQPHLGLPVRSYKKNVDPQFAAIKAIGTMRGSGQLRSCSKW